jgi:hypothetical protein
MEIINENEISLLQKKLAKSQVDFDNFKKGTYSIAFKFLLNSILQQTDSISSKSLSICL